MDENIDGKIEGNIEKQKVARWQLVNDVKSSVKDEKSEKRKKKMEGIEGTAQKSKNWK